MSNVTKAYGSWSETDDLLEWGNFWFHAVKQISYTHLPFQREEDRDLEEVENLYESVVSSEGHEAWEALSLDELNALYIQETFGCGQLPDFACIFGAPVHPDLGRFCLTPPVEDEEEAAAWHRAAEANGKFYVGTPEFSCEQDRLCFFDGPYDTLEQAMAQFRRPNVHIFQCL